MSDILILHLSDIHFKKKEDEDNKTVRQEVQKKLLETVTSFGKKQGNPDFVVVTGDIAFSGKAHEYDEAKEFFVKLKALLPAETIFLAVPGNHDVDRKKVSELVSLQRFVKDGRADKFLESNEKGMRDFIHVKFNGFREFCQPLNPDLYPTGTTGPGKEEVEKNYFWVKNFPLKQVSFLGLNSAWASEGDEDRFNIALGYPQVMAALEQSTLPHKIALMHHPASNWLKDLETGKSGVELFKHCSLLLHGHNHFHNALVRQDPSSACICLAANASYTGAKDGTIGFQFITASFLPGNAGVKLTVWPYIFDDRRNDFVPDRERWRSQAGKPYFAIDTLNSSFETKGTVEPSTPLRVPGEYRAWIDEFHSILPVEQLARKGEAILLSLPAVYIPLGTANPFYKPAGDLRLPQEKGPLLARSGEESEEAEPREMPVIDIEELLGRWNCLLVRGDAGMGKTTLIKHLAYSLAHGSGPAPLQGYLPVLVFLKEFWPVYQEELKKYPVGNITFVGLLEIYLKKTRCPLRLETVTGFLSQNRALLLLDGLDEVPASLRGDLVSLVHRFQFEHSRNRCLMTGRPHGLEGMSMQCFGKYLRDIEPLDEKKSGDFISRWFRAVSGQAAGYAEVNAADLSSDIRQHEHAAVFTRNPLLLTALCIFYLVGGKRIPDQRADLYDRIAANLLYRRFHHPSAPETVNRVREYLMLLAFHMQSQHRKSIDAFDAKELLKKKYPQESAELPHEYKLRIHRLFEGIEPVCGLLTRLSSGEIQFAHLSFQEFLAAKHMLDGDLDYKTFLAEPWWAETLLLYFGLMNLEMKVRSNMIIRDILTRHSRPYLHLLAARALRDFQPSKREEEVIVLTRKKLPAIIDSSATLEERFEAGEILGTLGDPRLKPVPMEIVEAGEFMMGSNERDREKPPHRVFLDKFMIGKFPVTNEEYKAFIEAAGYNRKEFWTPEGWQWKEKEQIILPEYWHDGKWNRPNFPVVGVSWYEAASYASWLSETTGNTYSLPTEAQWEKAARGTDGREYPWGNKFDQALCNSRECRLGRTSPVGTFPGGASSYGCLDMAGNVWEWCLDWFGDDYYKKSPKENPQGPKTGSDRVMRGGCWFHVASVCRSAYRGGYRPGRRGNVGGFRLLRSF